MSSFRPSAAVTGGIKITDPVNEPVREYRPGSPEAVSLEAEIARVGGEVRELPHVINGERLPLTDCFVIASAPNERQVQAVVDNVEEKLRAQDVKAQRREGRQEARWVLLDFGDVVVHVLHSDEREFYGLERLWKDCPRIEVEGLEAPAEDADADEETDVS